LRISSGIYASQSGGEVMIVIILQQLRSTSAELTPPVGASLENFVEKAIELRDFVHAVNITQNPMASPHMSTIASGLSLVQQGIESILQLTARDYNRLALQSAALGVSALGIHNILCLTSDPPVAGRGPVSGLPFDLDATQMIWILRRFRDEGHFLDGSDVSTPPRLFLGSAASPNDPNPNHEILRLKKKINAGAQFLQTQLVFSIERLERFLEAMDRGNLLDKVYILAGVTSLRSLKIAMYIQERIPDVFVPTEVIDRMESSETPEETGLEIALELVQKMKTLPGVSGVHLMNLGWDEFYPRLLREVRLLELIPHGNVHYNESNRV
jgi:methylenetetrahydrofolate reductase (NADPH)